MNSKELKPREHVSNPSGAPFSAPNASIRADMCEFKKKKAKGVKDEDSEWVEKYGEEGAKIIRETVEANMEDYEYLKQYAIKVE